MKPSKIEEWPPYVRKQLDEALGKSNRATNRVTDMEPTTRNESLATHEGETRNPPASIVVRAFRKRLCDLDGISIKAALDGIIARGILKGDGPKEIEEITYRQYKADEDRTVIEIWQ